MLVCPCGWRGRLDFTEDADDPDADLIIRSITFPLFIKQGRRLEVTRPRSPLPNTAGSTALTDAQAVAARAGYEQASPDPGKVRSEDVLSPPPPLANKV